METPTVCSKFIVYQNMLMHLNDYSNRAKLVGYTFRYFSKKLLLIK